jgi:hypothetical protein
MNLFIFELGEAKVTKESSRLQRILGHPHSGLRTQYNSLVPRSDSIAYNRPSAANLHSAADPKIV